MATADLKHAFVSAKADGPDGTLVRPGNWNATHKWSAGVQGQIVQRDTGAVDGASWATLWPFNHTWNADFEVWGAGTAVAPTGWTLTGAGATVARDGTNKHHGSFAVAVTRVGANARIKQDVSAIPGFGPAAFWRGRTIVVGMWVRATVANRARVGIADGVGETVSAVSHSGGSTFEFIQVSRTIDAAATEVTLFGEVHTGDTTAQFDFAILSLGTYVEDAVPSGWRGRKAVVGCMDFTTQAQATTLFYNSSGRSATETLVSFRLPFKCVARNLRAHVDAAPAAGQTVTFTLRKNEATDTALTAQVTSAGRSADDVANEVELLTTDTITVKVVTSATSGARACHATIEIEEAP